MTRTERRGLSLGAGAVVIAGLLFASSGAAQPRAPQPPQPPAPPRDAGAMVLIGPGASIGATVRDVTAAESEKQKVAGGVAVERVRPGGPAEAAGLKPSDIITQFDGEAVRSVRQFARLVQETPPGRTVKMSVVRDGKKTDLSIAPADDRRAGIFIDGDRLRDEVGRMRDQMPFDFDFDGVGRARLGVTVSDLTPQLAEFFGAKDGVLVTSVRDDSPAARAGLKAGDVITGVNSETVASARDLTRIVRNAGDDQTITLRVVRDKKETSLTAKLEPRQPRRDTRRSREQA
jgi:serine protease Do